MGSALGARAAHDLVRAKLAADDLARSELLSTLIRKGGRCRYCESSLTDESLAEHPEVCGGKRCQRKAAEEGFISSLPRLGAPGSFRREVLAAAGFHLVLRGTR